MDESRVRLASPAASDRPGGKPEAPRGLAGGREGAGRTSPDLKQLVDSLMTLQESERARVSTVLAEEVIPVLTMARYLIEEAAQRLVRGESDDTSESLQNAAARIRDAAQQVVALGQELRPRAMDDLGLVAALNWYLREFSQQNRAIFVSPRITVSEAQIPTHLKLAIFRIVQAALSNVARHSKASAARVLLSTFEQELRLGVEDNGVGFDVERWQGRRHGPSGCGLGLIARWVENSGGRLSIEAIPRHGARVQAFWRLDPVDELPGPASQPERPLAPGPVGV